MWMNGEKVSGQILVIHHWNGTFQIIVSPLGKILCAEHWSNYKVICTFKSGSTNSDFQTYYVSE